MDIMDARFRVFNPGSVSQAGIAGPNPVSNREGLNADEHVCRCAEPYRLRTMPTMKYYRSSAFLVAGQAKRWKRRPWREEESEIHLGRKLQFVHWKPVVHG
jgi:hypothetical protein